MARVRYEPIPSMIRVYNDGRVVADGVELSPVQICALTEGRCKGAESAVEIMKALHDLGKFSAVPSEPLDYKDILLPPWSNTESTTSSPSFESIRNQLGIELCPPVSTQTTPKAGDERPLPDGRSIEKVCPKCGTERIQYFSTFGTWMLKSHDCVTYLKERIETLEQQVENLSWVAVAVEQMLEAQREDPIDELEVSE